MRVETTNDYPWYAHYGTCPRTIDYPDSSLFGALANAARQYPRAIALRFLGTTMRYDELLDAVVAMSRSLAARGFRPGERVLVCLPNSPQAVIVIYALNRLGAVPAMIHPLSASHEIDVYRKTASCTKAVTLDGFYKRFRELVDDGKFEAVVVCKIGDHLKPFMKAAFWLTKGRKIQPLPKDERLLSWKSLSKRSDAELAAPDPIKSQEMAIILFSGGTTGEPKGIMLSALNFNALAYQTGASGGPAEVGDSMLSILPVFHGFGLAVGIHTMLVFGATCILVPTFTPESVAKLISTWKPQFMAGVPTLFDALAGNALFQSTDLSSFKGIFVGGDSLSREIKERFETILRKNDCHVMLREGYGLTESVTANMLMPRHEYRERSIGVPYPDMIAKIVHFGTTDEVPLGEEGEICVHGPTVMLGYLDHPEETALTLKKHADGRLWLHSGDAGSMDAEGFFFFKQRLKRIIKSSGISIYPSQVEDVISGHPAVRLACVIGVPHPTQVQVPQAYVVVNPGYSKSDELARELINWCRKELMPHACPRTVVFRDELPLTLVGKVAYRELEKEVGS